MDGMFETLFAPGLDIQGGVPLNDQLQSLLRHAILTARLPSGQRLPASRALANRLAVSRNTVLAAYDHLIAEGYLETRQGAGTYVSADLPDASLHVTAAGQAQGGPANPSGRRTRPLAGMPALDQFPVDVWARLAGSAWRQISQQQLLYSHSAGYLPLRRAIATYLEAARGVKASPDQIVITSGLQQGFRLIAESVIGHDLAILMEDPGYPGLTAAASKLPNPSQFIAVDKSGAQVPPDSKNKPGLYVVCPSRQYPLGQTMPLKRRLELLDWARTHGAYLLEDDYDSEFRYAGRPLNSLQGIDGGERVIYSGSFSKSLFLALRLGYLVLPEALVEPVLAHRRAVDSFPSISNQILLTRFIEDGHFARHILAGAATYLDQYFSVEPTDTGLHVVARAKATLLLDDTALAALAARAGLGASPLSASYHKVSPVSGLLFGFADQPESEIDNRLKTLARLIDQETHF